MADNVDIANDKAEVILRAALLSTHPDVIEENESQECLYCGEQTPSKKHRWCCPECARAWEAEQVFKQKTQGGVYGRH